MDDTFMLGPDRHELNSIRLAPQLEINPVSRLSEPVSPYIRGQDKWSFADFSLKPIILSASLDA